MQIVTRLAGIMCKYFIEQIPSVWNWGNLNLINVLSNNKLTKKRTWWGPGLRGDKQAGVWRVSLANKPNRILNKRH